jgi:hypothetical protein
MSAALTIDREQRDTLQSLMAYRLFLCHEVRLKRLGEEGVAVEKIALQFNNDMRFIQDIGWLERWLMETLNVPEAEQDEFELTLPRKNLIATLVRARADARLGVADAIKRTPTETDEERRARFQVAEQTCDELLARLDYREETP